MSYIILECSDGCNFSVDHKTAESMEFITNRFSALSLDKSEEHCFQLYDIDSSALRRAIKWAQHHQTKTEEANENPCSKPSKCSSEYDETILGTTPVEVADILEVADYLMMKDLIKAATKWMSSRFMEGKSVNELKRLFKIHSTEEEKQETKEKKNHNSINCRLLINN